VGVGPRCEALQLNTGINLEDANGELVVSSSTFAGGNSLYVLRGAEMPCAPLPPAWWENWGHKTCCAGGDGFCVI